MKAPHPTPSPSSSGCFVTIILLSPPGGFHTLQFALLFSNEMIMTEYRADLIYIFFFFSFLFVAFGLCLVSLLALF